MGVFFFLLLLGWGFGEGSGSFIAMFNLLLPSSYAVPQVLQAPELYRTFRRIMGNENIEEYVEVWL